MKDQWLEIFIKKEELKYFVDFKSEGLGKIDHLGGKDRESSGEGTNVMFFDMSLTEVRRLAIDRNCFRCAIKDAIVTSNEDKQLER